MRYIADENGVLLAVAFGAGIECAGFGCAEYTGGVPKGYDTLEEWYAAECECLCKWQIVEGELTLNASAQPPENKSASELLQAQIGNLENLNTTDKSSLVAALNEVAAKGGGGDGIYVTDAGINDEGHLIIYLSSGSEIDAGLIVSSGQVPWNNIKDVPFSTDISADKDSENKIATPKAVAAAIPVIGAITEETINGILSQ